MISERQNREKITTRQRRIKKPKKSAVDVTVVLSPSSSSNPVNNEDEESEEEEDDEEIERDNETNALALAEVDLETKEAVQVSYLTFSRSSKLQ